MMESKSYVFSWFYTRMQYYEAWWSLCWSVPHDEAIRLTDSPQTRMKPGFVRNQVYYSYNNFTTNENPWLKRHGTAGTLAVPFCYHDMEWNKIKEDFHKRLVALKTADAINAINGVTVSADARFLSEKWVRGELTGEQMKQELLDFHRKIATEENRSDYWVQKTVEHEIHQRRRPMAETGLVSLTDV